MTQETFNRMLAKARKRIADFDAIDTKHGFATPHKAETLVETAASAIEAGLLSDDESPIFDALIYLERFSKIAKP